MPNQTAPGQDKRQQEILALLNSSGFPFQYRIAVEIHNLTEKTGWLLYSTEHAWHDQKTGEDGYIDLVISAQAYRGVIECKRAQNAQWVFIVRPGAAPDTKGVRCAWVHHIPYEKDIGGWWNAYTQPASYESEMCVIRSHEDKARTLERLGSRLASSCDAFAGDLARFEEPQGENFFIVIPIIVTNASLYVAKVAAKDVSLETGLVDSIITEQVPFIRFRKSLTTRTPDHFKPRYMAEAHKETQRTIIIVNASHLELLGKVIPEGARPYPWEIARKQMAP